MKIEQLAKAKKKCNAARFSKTLGNPALKYTPEAKNYYGAAVQPCL